MPEDLKHYNYYHQWAKRQIRREQAKDAAMCGLAWLLVIAGIVLILSLGI